MESTSFIVARDLMELHEALSLVPRGGSCVQCDDSTKLQCPACSDGQSCQFTVPLDCSQCPKSVCMGTANPSSQKGGDGGGPNAGAIAGGVIGGIIFIAIVSYLVWRFLVKPNRSAIPQSIYESEAHHGGEDVEKDNQSRMTRRSSTHTVHSIASTVLTRASNIIQIAYIPGVTNRATPTSPTVLVPPVPPIPMQHATGSRESVQDEQRFFVPGDLRDSTYSGFSAYSDRTSYARTSYAPRSSIASTIYGKQAQVLTPAQTGMRAKPTMVSVKSVGSSANNTPGSTPPVPQIDFGKFNGRPQSGASAFSVGSTFLNNANTATQARAQVIKVSGGLKKIDIGSKSDTSSSAASTISSLSETPNRSSARDSNAVTIIEEDSPIEDQGPFSDPPVRSSPQKGGNPSGLAVVAEDSSEEEREGNRGSARLSSAERGKSPFGDQHATKE